jgi:nucleoside-diphosphate-sugar epimerase
MSNPLAADLDHVLAHTPEVWDALRGARLFITGGTGFFGCWLLESFAWACDRLGLDATATVLTRSPEAFRAKAPHLADHSAIRLHRGDVRSFEYPEGKFSHVIHGATEASAAMNSERPSLMLNTIVQGTRRALDFAASSGVDRFLRLSSGAVYGTQPPEIGFVPETWRGGPDPTERSSAYAEGKRVAELLCALSGLECPIARGFAFTGPYLPLDTHFAIGNFIRDCLEERPIEIRGDGTAFRSYLYAADLAIWLWTILVRGESCRAYNVGSEDAVSIAELAAAVKESLDGRQPVRIACAPAAGTRPARYSPDTGRARRELGLEQWIALPEAIRRTAGWYAAQMANAAGASA